MISKLQQILSDTISYINSLPIVDDIKEHYESLQEREKNILKIVSVVLAMFFIFSIFFL